MHLNITTNGALRILMICQRDRVVSKREMVTRLGLTETLVTKTCHELMKAGFLAGRRGSGGGYRLALPPEAIRVLAIIDLFEPPGRLFPCRASAGEECRIFQACKLRRASENAFGAFRAELEPLALADLQL